MKCHGRLGESVSTNDVPSVAAWPNGRFDDIDASNALLSHTNYNAAAATQTSHMWAGAESKLEAGAQGATQYKSLLDGRNGISRGKLICNRCHNPHGVDAYDSKILKMDNSKDQMCRDCHLPWATSDPDAFETHPMVEDYPAFAAANSDKYNTGYNAVTGILGNNIAQGEVRLVYNSATGKYMVSCTSCHGVHFTDSSSGTADGVDNYNYNSVGDGFLLRSDGPGRANKSALCQSCHTYAEHGDDGTRGTTEKVGCLVCHSGHSYNDGTPNYFILRKEMTTARYGAVTGVAYTQAPGTYTSPMPYNDGASVATGGICEKCHGDAETIPKGLQGAHGTNDRCLDCHYHYDPTFSFKADLGAASCGDCHGFPPHLNERGDRYNLGTYGGYAYDPATDWNYSLDTTNFKNEEQTAHLSHAGYNSTYVGYYRYTNCNACHGVDSGVNAEHNENSRGYVSFRDVPFDDFAKAGGALPTASYATGNPNKWKCSNVYCHSNGGPRNTTHTRTYNAGSILTPTWDQASGGGLNALIGAVDQNVRCSSCHGNSATEMSNKDNSPAHGKHLNAGITCDVCHADTAAGTTSLAAGATDVKNGGKHVNGTINVVLSASAVNGGLDLADYDPAQGTCATYCHDFAGIDPLIDWQDDTTVCGSCHGVTAATLTSGSHPKHLDPAGANISCDECHDDGAAPDGSYDTSAGAHADGIVTKRSTATSCDVCHGVEGSAAWDISPTWGFADSDDCRTCHAGAVTTAYTDASATAVAAPNKSTATTTGHNKETGSYTETDNPAANKTCFGASGCHIDIDGDHVGGAATKLLPGGALDCLDCHSAGGGRTTEATVDVRTHDNTDPTYTGQKRLDFTKVCLGCHDPHGSGNIAMIGSTKADFSGTVVFERYNSVTLGNGFDELDGGGANNVDDICATCHTTTLHNQPNVTEATKDHNEGKNCLGCHTHDSTLGGFMPSGGDFCNDCHANPPSPSDPRPADSVGAHVAHTNVPNHEPTEDKYDCGVCHQGGEAFDIDGAHSSAPLVAGIGYNPADGTCSGACHLSDTSDGFWEDPDGLNCDACHYHTDAVLPNGSHTKSISGSHTKHFDKGKVCTDCHDDNSADAGSHPEHRAHIDDHELWSLNNTNDGTVLADRGAATQDEATVLALTYGTGSDPDPGNPTCAGSGVGLGCHNTKTTPAWGGAVTCTNCHDPAGGATADPKSGLHDISAAAVQKHDSSLATNGCTECHNATKPASHANATWQDDQAGNTESRFLSRSGLVFDDSLGPNASSCFDNGASGAGSLDQASGCHSDNGVWKRRWSTEADSTATASGSSRCNVCHGQFSSLSGGAGWTEGTSHAGTYGGTSSNRGDTHNRLSGEANACEDCHAFATLPANHKNGSVTMNDDIGVTDDTEVTVGIGVYCAHCHTDGAPASSGTYTFAVSYFPLQKVAGANDPVVQCNSCHGQGGGGRFWPADPSLPAADPRNDAGRHEIHMTRLAESVMQQNVAQLLTNNAGVGTPPWDSETSENKQKELCSYCHTDPGHASHWDADGGLPAEVDTLYNLWNKGADDGTYSAGNCSNVNCHNGKATSATASFDWYGTGTGNCALCHNDITDTSAGTTGQTHQAHLTGPAFGKAIACGSCHGGSPSWDSDGTPDTYSVPSSNHLNGAFAVAGGSVIDGTTYSYDGAYTDAATRTVGTCGVNLCHNNGKNAATAAYAWQTAIFGCTACHGTDDAGLAEGHDGHLLASATYGKAVSCPDCHDAVTASDMTGKTNHMNGTVTLVGSLTYNGDLAVSGSTWGQCSDSSCHRSAPATAVNSPTWNTTASGCSTCHGSTDATLTSGRHEDHLPNAYIASQCGECHAANANNTSMAGQGATHISGAVDIGGTKTVSYGDPGCTNDCHQVNADTATYADWLDAQALLCTDCHTAGTLAAGQGALPTSGLHNMTASGVQPHNATLASNGCQECHVTPAPSHINGAFVADGGSNTDRFLTRTGLTWTDGAVNSGTCFDNGTTGLDYNAGAGCHRDDGVWKRLWTTEANVDTVANPDPGQLVCDACHGQYQSLNAGSQGWRENSVHYRSGASAAENKGNTHNKLGGGANACEDCHAYDSSGGVNHQNGVLNFSGGAGVPDTFTLSTGTSGWYCASCHDDHSSQVATDTDSYTFPDSLAFSSRAYVVGASQPEGGCTGCHGPSGSVYPDGQANGHAENDQPGAHQAHVEALVAKGVSATATCDYCHPGNTHGGIDNAVPADVSQTDTDGNGTVDVEGSTYFKYIVSGATDNDGRYDRTGDGRCSNIDCHANAPYTPGWHGDTVKPDPLSLTAWEHDTRGTHVPGETDEPGTVLLTWTAVGDDNGVDGTAHRYEVRYSTGAISNQTDWGNATIAGNPPTVDRAGKSQEMIVKGLSPGQAYYFAGRTYDEVGNEGDLSNSPTANAHADDVIPEFWGLDKVVALDETGAVKLTWGSAKDHTKPLTYDVYWDIGSIDYGGDDNHATTGDNSLRLTGLSTSDLYNFAVRACDGVTPTPNCETNATVLQVTPAASPEIAWAETSYYANDTSSPVTMVAGSWPGTSYSTGLPATFAGPAYASDTNIQGNTFAIYIDNGNSASDVTAELGYWNGSFQPFSPQVTAMITVGKRADRVYSFKFNNGGDTIPAGSRVAVQVTQAGGGAVNAVVYGTASQTGDRRGDLSLKEQRYNNLPGGHVVNTPSGSGIVPITWSAATDLDSDPIHYDVFGDCGEATPWSHVIATDLAGTSTTWDTPGAGIDAATCSVKVAAGDGFNLGDASGQSHVEAVSGTWSVDNGVDGIAPAAVIDLTAETRPKQGSVYLTWTAMGDDGANHGSRADHYDIRYVDFAIDVVANWDTANLATGEPVPDFSGSREGYELLLPDDEAYYNIGLKVCDEADNCSGIAQVAAESGPKCGVCHSTPPDENATAGNHAKHGYTMDDCNKCHGSLASTYGMAHQDGDLVLGWGGSAYVGWPGAGSIYYTLDGSEFGTVIYSDTDGVGGFNASGATQVDDGTCSNTVGCHGPATPSWSSSATLSCSDCHGSYTGYSQTDPGNTVNPDWLWDRTADAYNRPYDDASEDVEASPPVDLSGSDGGNSVGQHLKHLNFSFRFSKGDSCRLCHLDNEHADGNVDVLLDVNAAGDDALYNTAAPLGANGGVTCTGTTDTACHGTPAVKPEWNSTVAIACENCHHMGGTVPGHVTDGVARECNWCHVEGHPQGAETGTVLIPNNPAVGIDYKSGGIHLKETINGRNADLDTSGTVTEAEVCWTCHNANAISEWGADDGPANATAPGNGNDYDFGTLSTSDWTTATWYSAYDGGGSGIFAYKSGSIQSTHTVNPAGSSAVTWNAGASPPRYDETPDANALIRCSWCHDVHDLDLADNDTAAGAPFLRGSWLSSPYPEDGAPHSSITYTAVNAYGAVPRAGTGYTQMGGFFIDQNSPQPTTAGKTIGNSAGLCVLCHTDNVDGMDYTPNGNEGLWLGSNGHSNSAIGGTGAAKANIFDYSHGRPTPVGDGGGFSAADVPDMGYYFYFVGELTNGVRGYGYRGLETGKGYIPDAGAKAYSYKYFNWGCTVDGTTTDDGYHQFSCSKCHNPHASRLPKLMITNCLDVSKNSWDNNKTTQTAWTNPADNGKKTAYYTSAQNCHRYDGSRSTDQLKGGWNRVTPW
jgi:predicted CxxxxCH...CXXCH cytochrome family protein